MKYTNEKNRQDNWLVAYIKKNPLQVTLQLIGIGVLILNLFLANKLSPLVEGLGRVVQRVDAIEKKIDESNINSQDIAVIKSEVINLKEDVQEIKDSVNTIESVLLER